MELEYMLYFLLITSVICNFILLYKFLDEKERPKQPEVELTYAEMLEVSKKFGNNAKLDKISQSDLNIWYTWLNRKIKLLKSDIIKFDVFEI